ncbi:hypothetical protein TPB0596_12050 [Tsukamurella pulmonis]|uniref:hypothetical protein n=1 Tax=Tsukamurella pulmonis TaxID=47312 RepID=UPI001EDDBD84|nr:hypothetical protein [Tsukamurella pulmonis]BDD81442.1 hypothetical protein TPB0596_12050 [Tsukamurella pulmonis]
MNASFRDLMLAKGARLAELRAHWQHGDRVEYYPPLPPGFRPGPSWRPIPLYGRVIGQPVTVDGVTLIAVGLDTHQAVHAEPERLRNLTRED